MTAQAARSAFSLQQRRSLEKRIAYFPYIEYYNLAEVLPTGAASERHGVRYL